MARRIRASGDTVAAIDRTDLDEYGRIVAQAEDEREEADALVVALENRVRDGDETITPEEIESAKSLRGFARLRKEAAERKAERAREAERQRQLTALREEIETTSPTSRAELADLLKVAEDAVLAFVQACDRRNAKFRGWHDRMLALGVPALVNPEPPAEHQHLAFDGSGVLLVGKFPPARYSQVPPDGYVKALADYAGHAQPVASEMYELLRKEA